MEITSNNLFLKRNDPIDWRKFASVDVDRVAREVDVDAIQENIQNITYCNIEQEIGYQTVDPNFLKLFRLAQLTIEYLLHCQDYLQQCLSERDGQLAQLNESLHASAVEQEKRSSELHQRNDAYKNLKKELSKCKKLIADYQLMVRAGAGGLHKCTYCQKSFVSETYLKGHLERRHGTSLTPSKMSPAHQSANEIQANIEASLGGKLLNELNAIKTRLKSAEDNLISERSENESARGAEAARHAELLAKIQKDHDQSREEIEDKFTKELEGYKQMMIRELEKTQEEKKKT